MLKIPQQCKSTLAGKIRRYKGECFPGKGGGVRLAEEIGVTPQSISNWISGSRLPTMNQLYRLAKAFDVSPLELCGIRSRRATNPKTMHITVLQKLLQYCEKDIDNNANTRITRKFLLSVICIINNDLYE